MTRAPKRSGARVTQRRGGGNWRSHPHDLRSGRLPFRRADSRSERIAAQNSTPEKLIEAVEIIERSDAPLAADVTLPAIERGAGRSTTAKAVSAALDDLTVRAREVLDLLARDMSSAEIASTLSVGEVTVPSLVSKVWQKLDLRDRVHAVVFACEHGVVTRR